MKDFLNKYGSQLLRLIFSITIFYIVFKRVTSQESLDLFSMLNFRLLFVIVITGIIQIIINAAIQQNLLLIYNFKFPFSTLVLHNFISSMYLLIIPGVFAPDFYLAYQYGTEKRNFGRVIFTLVLNRLIGFIIFVALAAIGLFVLRNDIFNRFSLDLSLSSINKLYIVGALLLLVFLILSLLFRNKLLGYIRKFADSWKEINNKKNSIITAFLLKLTFNLVGISGRIIIGILLGISIPIWKFACIIFIINLLVALPISLNGIGVREAGYVGLLSMFGILGKISLSFALCEFGITLSAFIIGFILWILRFMVKKTSYGTNLGI